MSTTSLDTLLNLTVTKPVAAPAAKPLGGDAPSFENYLREASQPPQAPPQPAPESPAVTGQNAAPPPEESNLPAEEPTATAGQDQPTSDSSQEEVTDAAGSEVQDSTEVQEKPETEEQPADETVVSAVAAAILAKTSPNPEAAVESPADSQDVEASGVTQTQEGEPKPSKQNPLPGTKVQQDAEAEATKSTAAEAESAKPAATVDEASVQVTEAEQTTTVAAATGVDTAISKKQDGKRGTATTNERQSAKATPKQDATDGKQSGSTSQTDSREEVGNQVATPSTEGTQTVAADVRVTDGKPQPGKLRESEPKDDTIPEIANNTKLDQSVDLASLESTSNGTQSTSDGKAQSPTPVTATTNVPVSVGAFLSGTSITAEATSGQTQQDTNSGVSTVDRTRFVHRVANAFRSAQQNDGQIQLRLSPPELGSLKIEIAVRNGVLSANLETETAEARRVVLDNLPALRQRLAEQDIRIEKFQVDVRRDGGQSGGQTGAENWQSRQSESRAAANRIRTSAVPSSSTAARPQILPTTSSLDVRI
jgi:flagellar hook-length control protein FliK